MKKRGRRSSSSTHLLEGLQQQQSIDIIYKVCSIVHLKEILICFGREPVGRPSLQLRRQSSGHFESKLRTFVGVIRSDMYRDRRRDLQMYKKRQEIYSMLPLASWIFCLWSSMSFKTFFEDIFDYGFFLVFGRLWMVIQWHGWRIVEGREGRLNLKCSGIKEKVILLSPPPFWRVHLDWQRQA